MRIQHNISALNSHRNLGVNNAATAKNLEKLSSGFRINRAGDDAAGLAISEKMRGQIRGLAMAEQNTQNGISLIQTAEGGLNETHAILQRMRELAVQSSNGTYDEQDRANLEDEFKAITSEIDRISTATNYNGKNLLDGSLGKTTGETAVLGSQANGVAVNSAFTAGSVRSHSATTGALDDLVAGNKIDIDYLDKDGIKQSFSYEITASDVATPANLGTSLKTAFEKEMGYEVTVSSTASAGTGTGVKIDTFSVAFKNNGTNSFELLNVKSGNKAATISAIPAANVGKDDTLQISAAADMKFLEVGGVRFQLVKNSSELEAGAKALYVANSGALAAGDMASVAGQLKDYGFKASVDAGKLAIAAGRDTGLVFQIGANGTDDQRVALNVNSMSSRSIGLLDSTGKLDTALAKASIASVESANAAIDIIDSATQMVSKQRAGLGALQNRLEHTLNNLGVTKENLTSAESVIRDVDMAKEMMEFTKNQILVQASQSMLAQANMLPQGVLSLLQ